LQRFSRRELNFGSLFALAIFDLLATGFRVLLKRLAISGGRGRVLLAKGVSNSLFSG
jgi:hypothetical protein